MRPDLGQSPAPGARVPVGPLSIFFNGIGAGSSVSLLVGSGIGDSDIAVDTVAAPGPSAIVVPATEPVIYLSAFVTDVVPPNTVYAYQWAYGVGDAKDTVATVAQNTIVGHLESKWKRSELGAMNPGLVIPDPGHGLDEVSPVMTLGTEFNSDLADDVAPFSPAEVWSHQGDGTGYLECHIAPGGVKELEAAGCPPRWMVPLRFEVTIKTPMDGPELAQVYAGALSQIFSNVYIPVNSGRVRYIRNTEPPAEVPEYRGRDGKFDWHLWTALLNMHYDGIEGSQ